MNPKGPNSVNVNSYLHAILSLAAWKFAAWKFIARLPLSLNSRSLATPDSFWKHRIALHLEVHQFQAICARAKNVYSSINS